MHFHFTSLSLYFSRTIHLLLCFSSFSIMENPNEDGVNGKGSFVCRQSSTRWTPTTDQIRILKDLYYNNGVRSPSADQIQKISARLRQYGKIEGKNVFYWFQNHKARERQKKRFTATTTTTDHHNHLPMQRPSGTTLANNNNNNKKYPNITPAYSPSSPPSTGVRTVGQIANYGYGSMTMEKSFRDCSISACGSSSANASETLGHNFGWVGLDPNYSSSYTFFEPKKFIHGDDEDDDDYDDGYEEHEAVPQIETLPLFPMHGEDINDFRSNIKPQLPDSRYSVCYMSHEDGYAASRASLELSLNSYTGRAQDSSF